MATPQYVEQVQSNIPAWMQPYASQLLGSVFGGQDPTTGQFIPGLVGQGYQPYMVPKRDAQGNIVRDEKGQPVLEPGQRVAEFSPLQQEAFNRVAGMQVSPQVAEASGLASLAGQRAAQLGQYDPAKAQNFYQGPEFQGMGVGFERTTAAPSTAFQMAGPQGVSVQDIEAAQMGAIPQMVAGRMQAGRMSAPSQIAAREMAAAQMGPISRAVAQTFTAPTVGGFERVAPVGGYEAERTRGYEYGPLSMGPAERVGAEKFGLGAMQEYMSPYMQSVVERQKRGAVQDYMRELPGIGATAARMGAKGGTREALVQAEAQRNLANRLGDIEAQGLQQAYQQAASQFGQDRAAQMQAALANQQAGLTVGQQNLAAEQARQQFMGTTGLQSQLANQQAMQRAAEFSREKEMQAALANQAAGLNIEQQKVAAQLQTQGLNAQQAIEVAKMNQSGELSVAQANMAAKMQAEAANQQAAMQASIANQQAGMEVEKGNLAAQMQAEAANLQAAMQAGAANQQAGMMAAQANLQAQMQARAANQQYGLQAALANQQAGMQAGQTNLQALINQSQFGAGQGLQAQQMNQQAQLQAQQQALAQLAQANQFSQQNAAQRAQYGLAGANLAEQSRQFGAGLGMQGLQQQLAAAGMLGNLGQQQFGQQMGINQAMLGAGGQQQALNQQLLNTQYQDFVNQQQFPYKQAEFAMGILRGLPATGQTSTFYQQPASVFNQIAGAGMMGVGGLFGGLGQTT